MTNELINYFSGDEFAASTWENKYAKRDENGELMEVTPDDMHRRLADEFARIESYYPKSKKAINNECCSSYYKTRTPLDKERIFNLFKDFKYVIPAGSVMAGLGNKKPVSLSNCFVLPSPEDSYGSIMMTRLNQAELMKRRGGVGYDLSNLRPRGASVNNAAITSTGAASFMDVCSDVTNEVAQQGRRGALMLTLNINHPDVVEFIEKKQDLTKVTGANVSVQVTDEFMQAVKNDETYLLRWPVHAVINEALTEKANGVSVWEQEYGKLYKMAYGNSVFDSHARVGYMKKVRAKDIWDKIIHCAWNTAEPGIIFKDRMDNFSPDGVYSDYRGVSTNPCSEIYMSGNESCRLMAINMLSFVDNPFTKDAKLNTETVYEVTYEAMRLSDDLVDLENDAVKRIIEIVKKDKYSVEVWKDILKKGENGRRVGLEFTALSDMVAALGKKFCTKEGNDIVNSVCKLMMCAVLDCQVDMALERGTFPSYEQSYEFSDANEWYKEISNEYPARFEHLMRCGHRNISFTTAGPTGSLSILARTSSGIEPLFMPYYVRRRKCMTENDRVDYTDKMGINFTEFVVVHPQLKKWASLNIDGFEDNDGLTENGWREIYEKSPWFGACAQDIDWSKRVELQGIVQKRLITHSISSTVNLPNDVSEEEVSNIYKYAWENGLKGITVYRDGSREGIMLKKEKKKEDDKFESYVSAPKRPKTLDADFYVTKVKGEMFYVMVGLYKEKPYEIFVYRTNEEDPKNIKNHKGTITKIKKGVYCYESDDIKIDNISMRLTTEELATVLYSSMLMRTGANLKYIIKTAQKVDDNISSFTAAMTRILKKYLKDEFVEGEVCPECGGRLIRENGCIRCIDCGWSRCE